MRTLLMMVSISALGLAGVAAAAPPEAGLICSAPVAECRIALARANGLEPHDYPVHHLMTKAEARAELDALRLGAVPARSEVATASSHIGRATPTEDRER